MVGMGYDVTRVVTFFDYHIRRMDNDSYEEYNLQLLLVKSSSDEEFFFFLLLFLLLTSIVLYGRRMLDDHNCVLQCFTLWSS
jgi:hypothetical protein